MMTKIKKIKFIFIFFILISSFLTLISCISVKALDLYNANVVLDVDWDLNEIGKPVIPRDEVKELNITITFRIETGDYFAKGLLIGYTGSSTALIDVKVVETSSWCHAILERTLVQTNISSFEQTKDKIYLTLDETTPAFVDGYIKINVSCAALGLLKGFEDTFTLAFSPSYLPIIKVNLPQANSIRINPDGKAVFPIQIENAGNAKTKVMLDIESIAEGWGATVSEEILLEEPTGSKAIAYLTVIPPNNLGYHYDDTDIKIKIIPSQAENPDLIGKPLYATFLVQNRGFSSSGLEYYLIVAIIIFVILVLLMRVFRKKRKEKFT